MWWEILPSFFITTGVLAIPALCGPIINKLAFDHKYRRQRHDWWDRMYIRRDLRLTGDYYQLEKYRRQRHDWWDRNFIRRDLRLTGNYYKLEGLNALPDVPAKPGPVKEVPELQVKNPGILHFIT